jgi:hypothetical protein
LPAFRPPPRRPEWLDFWKKSIRLRVTAPSRGADAFAPAASEKRSLQPDQPQTVPGQNATARGPGNPGLHCQYGYFGKLRQSAFCSPPRQQAGMKAVAGPKALL